MFFSREGQTPKAFFYIDHTERGWEGEGRGYENTPTNTAAVVQQFYASDCQVFPLKSTWKNLLILFSASSPGGSHKDYPPWYTCLAVVIRNW